MVPIAPAVTIDLGIVFSAFLISPPISVISSKPANAKQISEKKVMVSILKTGISDDGVKGVADP